MPIPRKRQPLDSWIKEAINDVDKEGKCTMIALVHLAGTVEKEIHVVRLGSREWDPMVLAQLFQGKANSFSQDLPGVQTFNLLAFYDERSEPEARHPFTVQGENDYGGLTTEAPNPQGLTQQAMRHTEAMTQITLRGMTHATDILSGIVEQQTREADRLRGENTELVKMLREMAFEQIRLDHEKQMKELEFARASEERQALMRLAPALVNTIAGKEVFPQSSEDTALVNTVIENLKPEQIKQLMSILPPTIMGPLSARAARYLKEKEERAQTVKQLAERTLPEDEEGLA